jgi:hypothetical protein
MPNRDEPELRTAPELAGVLRELIEREPIFHRPEPGVPAMGRADFERMMDKDFWETGASGRRYSRTFVLEELDRRFGGNAWKEDPWEASDFCCRRLAGEVFLFTYTLIQRPAGGARKTRRVTIWEKTGEGWKIVYHQGTLVE